jgi:hypothetical protein
VNFFFTSTLPLSPSAQVKGRLAKINPYGTNLHVDDPP